MRPLLCTVTPPHLPPSGPTFKHVTHKNNLHVGVSFSFRKNTEKHFLFVSIILGERKKKTFEFRDFSNY